MGFAKDITLALATSDTHVFAGNDVFDPDKTAGATQPPYFDVLKLVYQAFYVRSAQIDIAIVSSSTVPFTVAVFPSSLAAITSNDITDMVAYPSSSYATVLNNLAFLRTSANSRSILGNQFSPSNPDCLGSPTASPTQLWYFLIWAQTFGGNLSGVLQVRVKYDVEFTELIPLIES
jgi:hypothetical protein